MGSGKSAVGRALAARLGRDHVDIDDLVVTAEHRSIQEIFATGDEEAFRTLERHMLVDSLRRSPAVISTGGGIVLDGANRALLTDGRSTVVWLDACLDALVGRVGDGRSRPLLEGDVRERLSETVHDRAPLYAEVAGLRVDTSHLGVDVVADEIIVALDQEVTA